MSFAQGRRAMVHASAAFATAAHGWLRQSEGLVIGNLFFKRFDQRGVIIRRRRLRHAEMQKRSHTCSSFISPRATPSQRESVIYRRAEPERSRRSLKQQSTRRPCGNNTSSTAFVMSLTREREREWGMPAGRPTWDDKCSERATNGRVNHLPRRLPAPDRHTLFELIAFFSLCHTHIFHPSVCLLR